MRLRLVSFGKLKTPGLRQTADHYLKQLKPWVALEEIELKPLSVSDKSAATRKAIQEKESALLLETLSPGGRSAFYLLDEAGKSLTTRQWAEQVRAWESASLTDLSFCIGSSLGFGDELRKKARGSFNLGLQTLPHELARVVLIEQLYRAWSVVRGHPYHNEGS